KENEWKPLSHLRIKQDGARMFLIVIVFSSLAYSINHFNKRFFVFNSCSPHKFENCTGFSPFRCKDCRPLLIKRAGGVVVSTKQFAELEKLADFIDRNTQENEPVFVYP